MKTLLTLIVSGILVTAIATCALVKTADKKPVSPPSQAHESDSPNGGLHWRLVAEADYDGKAIKRNPLTKIHYTTSESCARVGSSLPEPPKGEGHISYLIRCLPYHNGEDTDTSTPL